MTEIYINNHSSDENLTTLKELFRDKKWTSVEIEMIYNPEKGLTWEEDKENWPFYARLVDVDGKIYVVRIYTLTVGYGGSGPHDFASILDFFHIRYYPNEVFTKLRMDENGFIHLKYMR